MSPGRRPWRKRSTTPFSRTDLSGRKRTRRQTPAGAQDNGSTLSNRASPRGSGMADSLFEHHDGRAQEQQQPDDEHRVRAPSDPASAAPPLLLGELRILDVVLDVGDVIVSAPLEPDADQHDGDRQHTDDFSGALCQDEARPICIHKTMSPAPTPDRRRETHREGSLPGNANQFVVLRFCIQHLVPPRLKFPRAVVRGCAIVGP